MFKYNKDQKRRDELLGLTGQNYPVYSGDYARCEGIDVKLLKILLDEKFANPDEIQNEAPSIREFYDFMVEHPEYRAIGYAIGGGREDYRVSIEGLEGAPKDENSMLDFAIKFRLADEFDLTKHYARCWYD